MFIVEKYKGKFAVLDTKTCVWYFIGKGKKYCELKAKELNQLITRSK